jgi:hypothetical protein
MRTRDALAQNRALVLNQECTLPSFMKFRDALALNHVVTAGGARAADLIPACEARSQQALVIGESQLIPAEYR